MYSQDPHVRRRRLKLRFFYYGLMAISVPVLTVVAVLFILGYRLSVKESGVNVSRGGLVKFDTVPRGAAIYFDNLKIDATTPHQVNINAGQHTLEYTKEGYQKWQKNIVMHPGELLPVNYARLIPASITTTNLRELPTLHQTLASPDREWLALHETAENTAILFANATNERNVAFKTIILPQTAYTQSTATPQVFELASWSRDSKFLLIKHTFGTDTEYIRLPRDNESQAVNVTKLFGLQFGSLQFAANNPNILFATDQASNFYRLDVGRPNNKSIIAKKVSAHANINDNEVAYITSGTDGLQNNVVIRQHAANKNTVIRKVAISTSLRFTYHSYLAHDFLTIAAGTEAITYRDPLTTRKIVQQTTLPFQPDKFSTSPGGRFIVGQQKELIHVHDLDLAVNYTLNSEGENRAQLQWLDDHYLAKTGSETLRITEFDGTNTQTITRIAPGEFDALLGADGRILLSIGPGGSAGGLQLQQSQLLTEKDQNAGLF